MTPPELSAALKNTEDGLVVSCHIQPNASRTAVSGMYGNELKVALKAPPVDGKANQELCRFFSETFQIPSGAVQLLSGHSSRKKRIFLRGLRAEHFLKEFAS